MGEKAPVALPFNICSPTKPLWAKSGRPGAIGYTGLGALSSGGDRVEVVALRVIHDPRLYCQQPKLLGLENIL